MKEYWSIDKMFGIAIQQSHIDKIAFLCKKSFKNETGGIIIGEYKKNLSCATVADIVGQTADSKSGPTWFVRGIKGLQNIIDQYWINKRHYYLGEWHFHPFASPTPSKQDITQMQEIARMPFRNCPEPILIIAGGNPSIKMELRVFVFPKGHMVELFAASQEYE
jgi:hypothetical protein